MGDALVPGRGGEALLHGELALVVQARQELLAFGQDVEGTAAVVLVELLREVGVTVAGIDTVAGAYRLQPVESSAGWHTYKLLRGDFPDDRLR